MITTCQKCGYNYDAPTMTTIPANCPACFPSKVTLTTSLGTSPTPSPQQPSTVEELPTAVTVKPVLKLIQAHTQGDDYAFKEAAMEVARELELNGKQELYLYIYAQFGMVNTFEITD